MLVEETSPATLAPPEPEMAMANHGATNISIKATMKILKIRRSTPDLVALNPFSGRGHRKETKMVHLVWTKY